MKINRLFKRTTLNVEQFFLLNTYLGRYNFKKFQGDAFFLNIKTKTA